MDAVSKAGKGLCPFCFLNWFDDFVHFRGATKGPSKEEVHPINCEIPRIEKEEEIVKANKSVEDLSSDTFVERPNPADKESYQE